VSGAFPVGITASALDIRGISFTRDSISVLNTVGVSNGEGTPFVNTITQAFQTRLLRASTGDIPLTNQVSLQTFYTASGTVEDTVRVVGVSGAAPVPSLAMGRTGSVNVPLRVDAAGHLFVNLASGTIGVTANIASTNFTLSGLSLAAPGTSAGSIYVQGYAGADGNPVKVSATDLDIRNLNPTDDIVGAVIRVLGASGDYVGLTGNALSVLNSLNAAIATVTVDPSINRVRTDDANAPTVISGINATRDYAEAIKNTLNNASSNNSLRVNVVSVSQPSGITSGRVSASSPVAFGSFTLSSGIHLKADITNSNTTPIFVGAAGAVTINSGFPLYNGDTIFIETDNASKIVYACAAAGLTLYYVGT
jgi:hypothetical protein